MRIFSILLLVLTSQAVLAQTITDTGSKVGIGTATPQHKLEVNGDISVGRSDGTTLGYGEKLRFKGASYNSDALWIARFNTTNNQSELRLNIGDDGDSYDKFVVGYHYWNGQEWRPALSVQANGKIGIGTDTPLSGIKNPGIHIDQSGHTSVLLGDPINKKYGGILQTSDNKHRIFIGANLYDNEDYSWKSFEPGKGGAGISIIADKGDWGNNISFFISEQDDHVKQVMRIVSNGDVGIGTINPDAKLAVKGPIHAEEVKVDLSVPAPDYVFAPDYKLSSLQEIEAYIQENSHLPEVPSAAEMEAEGIELSKMNMLLLKKVEELTLHLIQQQKEIDQLKAQQQIK